MLDEEIVRVDYSSEIGIRYLTLLNDLYRNGFITPGTDRDLEDKGKEVVSAAFPKGIEVDRIVSLVRAVQLTRHPHVRVSELDAFVMDASSARYVLTGDTIKIVISAVERTKRVPENGTYTLAGIHILRRATEQGLIEVNPLGAPKDQCYVRLSPIDITRIMDGR